MDKKEQCIWEALKGDTLTVGELRSLLQPFSDDMPIYSNGDTVERCFYQLDADGAYLDFR